MKHFAKAAAYYYSYFIYFMDKVFSRATARASSF
jgi:hypothetical protein